MTRAILFSIGLATLTPVAAAAQERPSFDPMLRRLMDAGSEAVAEAAERTVERRVARESGERSFTIVPDEAQRARGLSDGFSSPFDALALDRSGPGGQTMVGVLVRLREPVSASLAALRRAGAVVGIVIGDIATARVPVAGLERLADVGEIRRVEAARRASLVHDISIGAVRADEVRERDGDLWFGSAGHGVIFGIYDTGIDYGHGDFLDGDGRSRILALWDQGTSGDPPPGFNYGFICEPDQMNRRICPEHDVFGHGTHVAGTAVGDGSAVGDGGIAYRFAGIAPAADLLVVKGDDYTEDEIAEAVYWIFQTAEQLGRPAVVNLSLGLQWGPRDGTTLFEQALDAMSGPGRIIVAASGNDASNGNAFDDNDNAVPQALFHAMDEPIEDGSVEFDIEVPDVPPLGGTCNDYAVIEVWYDGADTLDITVVRPDGSSLTAVHDTFMVGPDPAGLIWIDNAYTDSLVAGPENGDHVAYIEISDCRYLYEDRIVGGDAPAPGTWTIRATAQSVGSTVPAHLWISLTAYGVSELVRGVSDNFDNGYIVSSPATAREVIAVGAFVTRTDWLSIDGGRYRWLQREEIGDIAHFSNGGPTRDGRLKPEITAPGRTIVSALSGAAVGVSAAFIAPDGVHVALQGTSMATPHVAGAVALLLQHDPTLSPDDVRQIFARTAATDEWTANSYTETDASAGTPNNQWGYGKLDVLAAVEDVYDPTLASELVVVAEAVQTPASASSERGSRFALLRLHLRADGPEAIQVSRAGFTVLGDDPRATLSLVEDLDGDAGLGAADSVLVGDSARLTTSGTEVGLSPRGLVIPANDSTTVLLAIELSGNSPNGATFQARYEPSLLRTVGLRTGDADRQSQDAGAVASGTVEATVLRPGEVFSLSENPVMSDRVIFNFSERPRVAAVYTVGGGRVVDLLGRMETDGRVEWDLTNARGSKVAPGIYLVVFDVAGEMVTRKLIIVRPSGREE